MLTKAMCVEWAKYNIQVNGIGPGYIRTEMNVALDRRTPSSTPSSSAARPPPAGARSTS